MSGSAKTGTAAAVFIVFLMTMSEALTLSGTCTDYITDTPIDTCRILLEAFSPGAVGDSTRTGSDGRYSFAGLAAGVFKIVIADSRYAPDTLYCTIEEDTEIPFVLDDLDRLLDSLPDTLYKEHSPYMIRKGVSAQRFLFIEPGVTILFRGGDLMINHGLSAIGTVDDSIIFTTKIPPTDSIDYPTGRIGCSRGMKEVKFVCCRFERLERVTVGGYSKLNIEQCRFSGMYNAITLEDFELGIEAVIAGNIVTGCTNGIVDRYPTGGTSYSSTGQILLVTGNLLKCDDTALRISPYKKAFFGHNSVLGMTTLNMNMLEEDDTVTNNIFSTVRFDNASNDMLYFANNVVDTLRGEALPGIGRIVQTNVNGDSCDYFFNLFQDPRIADSATGQLYEGSVCIGAASDGTDIGVYHGEPSAIKAFHSSPHVSLREHMVPLRIERWTIPVPARNLPRTPSETCIIELYTLQGKLLLRSEQTGSSIDRNAVAGNTQHIPFGNTAGCCVLHIKGNRTRIFTTTLRLLK
jgi:hypothetical protein